MLSEIGLCNDEHIIILNFDCCVQFQREGQRANDIAMYQKLIFGLNMFGVVTPNRKVQYRQTSSCTGKLRAIGDICAAEFLKLKLKLS